VKQLYVVNEHLDVVLEDNDKTHIYIDGVQFIQCMRLVLNIPLTDNPVEVTSIDDAKDSYGTAFHGHGIEPPVHDIYLDSQTEFQGHCSNIQAWIEHDYNPRLLHSSIAFPLLKALARAGDDKARRVLDGELETRIKEGSASTRVAILETCGELLNHDLYMELLDEVPEHHRAHIWFNTGYSLQVMGNLQSAIIAYRNAIVIKPDYAQAWYNLGSALEDTGDAEGAIEADRRALIAYRKTATNKANTADAWDDLRCLYARLKARRHYLLTFSLDPEDDLD
jgi:tetratricopeptide (TPR) repeat protein